MPEVVLLVEDNDDDAELTRMAFEKARISNPLVRARDGVEALDYLLARGKHAHRDPGDLPVLVLLDLKLPRVDGIEVLKTIRANEAAPACAHHASVSMRNSPAGST